MRLPKLNGIEAIRQIHALVPRARILCISLDFSYQMVETAFRLGAVGYLDKLRFGGDLLRAIEAIRNGRYFVSGVARGGFGDATIDKPPLRHEVQLCSDDGVLRESFIDFVATTLKADRAAVVVASESHRADVLQGLRARNLDVDETIKTGRLISLDATETLSTMILNEAPDPARLFDAAGDVIDAAATAAMRKEGPRVAICRECPPFLLAEGRLAEALRLDKLWSLIAYTSRLDMLCGYVLASFEKRPDILQAICAEHSVVSSR